MYDINLKIASSIGGMLFLTGRVYSAIGYASGGYYHFICSFITFIYDVRYY